MRTGDLASLPEDASFPRRLWVGLRAFRRLLRDVTDPVHGAMFQESLDGGRYARFARELRASPDGRAFLSRRSSLALEHLDLARMAALPAETLGAEVARFYGEPRLNFPSPQRTLTDAQYLAYRMRQSHDLHHMLTGYGTDSVGEHELQAFQFGNLRTPTSLVTLVFAVHKRYSVPRRTYFRRLWRAYRRGRASPPIVAMAWEELWEAPLATVRERYCAPRG